MAKQRKETMASGMRPRCEIYAFFNRWQLKERQKKTRSKRAPGDNVLAMGGFEFEMEKKEC
jgi:hypothetical protein